MKKNQGAKGRSTYQEALRGDSANGIVGFFIGKLEWRKGVVMTVEGIESLKTPSRQQLGFLKGKRQELVLLDNEIAQILQDAPKYHPSFLKNLAKAQGVKVAAYPVEVRLIERYTYFRFVEGIEKELNEHGEDAVVPSPADVSHQRLYDAVIDENGFPNPSTFSRMVKRYNLLLTRKKAGRRKSKSGLK